MNFSPSASGWPRPNIFMSFRNGMIPNPSPTRLGPIRSCTHDATFRSSRIRYATVPSTARCATIAIQTQGGMCVEIQFSMIHFVVVADSRPATCLSFSRQDPDPTGRHRGQVLQRPVERCRVFMGGEEL